jgi:hypothetical protein
MRLKTIGLSGNIIFIDTQSCLVLESPDGPISPKRDHLPSRIEASL